MKALNENVALWSEVAVEAMEVRDEYGWCFSCFCFDVKISCLSIGCI